MTDHVPPPSLATKLAFGSGAIAYGVKNNGFDYFLLIFYSQVMGVDAALVGLALLIALMVDALSDPLVGYWSDNTHSRWGRRHPFMYAAALPVAVSYFFLWNPPAGLNGNDLFPYVLLLSIFIRLLITFYEVPSSSLVPEFTDDYDQRTAIVGYRYYFGWTGGTLIAVLALSVFLVPTETIKSGFFNVEGYGTYGLVASLAMFVTILISAIGTHHRIPHLRQPPPKQPMSPGRIFREIFETLANRSFLSLFLAALLGATATGIAGGLNYYLMGFFWEFTPDQVALLSASVLISALLALVIAPVISLSMGKKYGAIVIGVIAFVAAPMPIFLRLIGVMPENGDPLLFGIMLPFVIIDLALIITTQILMTAMIADIVEESELRTRRRSEGVFFAAITFSRKFVQGFGVLSASLILTAVSFPKEAAPGTVEEQAVRNLGLYYGVVIITVWMLMISCLFFYRISRARHEENLRKLAGG